RHHIPKQRHRVTNWAAYDVALRQRGSLTVWLTETAIAAWKAEPRCTRGGQPRYSALAITTATASPERGPRWVPVALSARPTSSRFCADDYGSDGSKKFAADQMSMLGST